MDISTTATWTIHENTPLEYHIWPIKKKREAAEVEAAIFGVRANVQAVTNQELVSQNGSGPESSNGDGKLPEILRYALEQRRRAVGKPTYLYHSYKITKEVSKRGRS